MLMPKSEICECGHTKDDHNEIPFYMRKYFRPKCKHYGCKCQEYKEMKEGLLKSLYRSIAEVTHAHQR